MGWQACWEWAKRYHQPLVVPEAGREGNIVIKRFLDGAYPYIYITQQMERIGGTTQNKAGYVMARGSREDLWSDLHHYVEGESRLEVRDKRMKAEMNFIVWHETPSGMRKAAARRGKWCFDDMHTAYGLAIMGRTQVSRLQLDVRKRKPSTHEEMLQWERKNARLYEDYRKTIDDEEASEEGYIPDKVSEALDSVSGGSSLFG